MRDPFDQLERSHRRLEETLDDLARAGIEALRDAAAFFARNVRRHEEDEELTLFPRLAANADLAPVVARLAREHAEHEALHARLDALVHRLDSGEAPPGSEIDQVTDALARAYRDHIDVEERELFPRARTALGEAEREAMSREMDARRGRT